MRFTYDDFARIYKSCNKATCKDPFREFLRYIELRAANGKCVATALDGYILCQVEVPCEGEGVICIPPVKPPKCHAVQVDARKEGLVRIAYYDYDNKLIYAYELPGIKGDFFNWEKVVPYDRQGDRRIFCNVNLLKKALECFKGHTNPAMCISVPENPIQPIVLYTPEEQAVVLVQRVGESHANKYKVRNMYALGGMKNEQQNPDEV